MPADEPMPSVALLLTINDVDAVPPPTTLVPQFNVPVPLIVIDDIGVELLFPMLTAPFIVYTAFAAITKFTQLDELH